ncbi:MAG: lasso peptide biosynthesis B2 protein [Brevundimonas sp.]|uniref:lasso peptide biosynthesis B2 protein n=1 Tax=Brevundimonas sp. TaxID=1871086 RepID=UPI00271C60AB|nr:lasso peptide biosynthesis B2 protein [Brevundimonas sp.]MDO9587377.1 lasso peptide biosynthesis B2 protein [Brevundimonas sp.]
MPQDNPVFLAPHIHLARCHDDLVVLDVRADDYALLVDAATLVRFGARPGEILADDDVLGELRALDLIADTSPDVPRFAIPDLTGEIASAAGPFPLPCLARAAFDSLVSTAAFAKTPFAALVETAGRRRAAGGPLAEEQIARAAGAFQAVHPWIPFEGDCLQRGYRLHHHLRRAGVPARWVFGVRTWPFLAHCWVQVGDRVVGDTRERVSSFTPIMVV